MQLQLRWFMGVALVLLGALLAHPASAAPDPAATLKAAQTEGTVVVHGPPGRAYEAALTKGFEQANPGIKVEYSGANNRTAVPKLFREREAGLFLWDVWIGGPATTLSQMMPKGVFAQLPPVLYSDTTADDKWVHGFADGWMDRGKTYVYAFDAGLQETAIINWDVVKREDVKSVRDILKPQYAGKILFDEPRRGGSGNGSSMGILVNFGEEFLRKLYAQKVAVNENRRQTAEWLVRGRYPIVFGTGMNELAIFREQGLGKNIGPIPMTPGEKIQMTPGFGAVSLVDRAPHRNAAIVYVNWLLSADGQRAWTDTERTSRRLDIPCDETCQVGRDTLAKAGDNYFKGQDEDAVPLRERAMVIAKEAIKSKMAGGESE
ncbi:MAG TPA: extracellular solute-binding protein [Alphaproteobacteria bacterium]|jgi:iron(III) transport system substrate-binding protein|nr:extracellular solute-binding protein [Alphaproteobacteria bacterium]